MSRHWSPEKSYAPNKWAKNQGKVLNAFFDRCLNPQCESGKDLEFIHLDKTEISGRGRGRKERLHDLRQHPDKYSRLCDLCHEKYDKDEFGDWAPPSLLEVASQNPERLAALRRSIFSVPVILA